MIYPRFPITTHGDTSTIHNLLKTWKYCLIDKDMAGILDTYSPDAVLLGTFATNIKQGRNIIGTYFEGLFKKKGLSVKFMPEDFINKFKDGAIISGIYTFSYDEGGKTHKVKARYTFACKYRNERHFIINHHSSVVPE